MKKRDICHTCFTALFFCLAIFFSTPVCAETGYVSDRLVLTMRSGPGDQFPVMKTLISNTALEILEKGERYFKVSLEDGNVGWVQKQYITYNLPAPLVIVQMQKKVDELVASNAKLLEARSPLAEGMDIKTAGYEEKISKIQALLDQEIKEKKELASALDKALKEHERFLNDSKDTVSVISKNRDLEKENARLSDEISKFKEHKEGLLMTSMMKWFLAGAGVMIIGWIMGRSMGGSKRSSRLLS